MDPLECLYFKDKKMFTEDDYKSIRKDFKAPICSLHELLKTKDELNMQFTFTKQTTINATLLASLNQLKTKYYVIYMDYMDKIKIKICVDGTKIGRKLYLLNFAFSIINDFKNCISCYSHYTLAIGEIKECYEDLKEPMDYLIGQLKKLSTINFRDKNFTFEYDFAADLKLALIITGLKAANSDYLCRTVTVRKIHFI